MLVYFQVLLIYCAITTTTWFIGVALYRAWVGPPHLHEHPLFYQASAVAIVLGTLAYFVPFPWGYLITLGLWWPLTQGVLELPAPRALALFLILAGLSVLARLAIHGALNF